jgi:hypothetical protein
VSVGLFGPPDVDKLAAKGKVDGLIKALAHEDPKVREQAARALGDIGDPRATEPLIAATRDEKRQVADSAMWALGGVDDLRAVEALVPLACEGKERAAWALGRIGAPAVEPLLAALDRGSLYARKRMIRQLGKIGDVRAVEPLIAMLGDRNASDARDALVELGDPAVEHLVKLLRSPEESRRSLASSALQELRWAPVGPDEAAFWIARKDVERIEEIDAGVAGELLIEAADWNWAPGDWPVTMRIAHLLLRPEAASGEGSRAWAREQLDAGAEHCAEELDRVFNHPVNSYAASDKRYRPMFGDYAALIIQAASFTQSSSADDSGTRFFSYGIESSHAAVERLCEIDTPVSSNVLQLVTRLADLDVVTRTVEVEYDEDHLSGESCSRGVLSFADHRSMARNELARRGDPEYDLSAYKVEGCWRMREQEGARILHAHRIHVSVELRSRATTRTDPPLPNSC